MKFKPCPVCKGFGYEEEYLPAEVEKDTIVICPDCAGTGRAENSITANKEIDERESQERKRFN